MTEQHVVEKNLELSTEFSKLLLTHPELEAKIPEGAQIVFLVANDPALSRKNRALAAEQKKNGQTVLFVHVKGLRPDTSRLIAPRFLQTAR